MAKLRQIEVPVGEGKSIHLACKAAGFTAQAPRLQELERENRRLKRDGAGCG